MKLARLATVLAAGLLLAACGGIGIPGVGTTPPPTVGGGTTVPAGGVCSLVTADEMSQIFGVPMTVENTDSNSCTYIASGGLPSVNTRFEQTDLATAKTLLGTSAADVTVNGNPGVIGNLFGVILYVQHGNQDLVVQCVLLTDTPDNRNKAVAVATKALSRVP